MTVQHVESLCVSAHRVALFAQGVEAFLLYRLQADEEQESARFRHQPHELRILGALRVPVVVFLSEDYWEIGRFGDRMLSVYRAKAAREVGRPFKASILSPSALAAEMAEWVDVFEWMLIMLRLSPPLRRRHGD